MAERADRSRRILVLTPQLPYPPHQGRSLRNYNLLRYLAEGAGHQVSLLSFATPDSRPEDLAHLRAFCRTVEAIPEPVRTMGRRLRTLATSPWPDMAWRLASPAFERALLSRLAQEPFDVLQIEGIELARYLWLPELAGPQRPLVVFDDHNAEYLLQKRACATDSRRPRRWAAAGYSFVQWLRLRRFEREVCRRSDRVIAVSAADAAALRALDPALQPSVVPNGVDLEYFHPAFRPSPALEHPCVVFTGKMDFRPNIDAVLWFARRILPRLWAQHPGLCFYVVGQSPSPRLSALQSEPRITITGRVDDVRPYIAGADVYVVPLLVGGGTRLKVLEAMAMGQALVSTRLGVEGLGVTGGDELLLADEPAAFAAQILALLDDKESRRRLGRQAREFVERRYGWGSIGPRLETAYGPLNPRWSGQTGQ